MTRPGLMYKTNAEIVSAIQASQGLVSVAARRLGVSRRTLYNRINKSRVIREALADARELTSDVAEAKLFQAIRNGEAWAIKFYLQTVGKQRGYISDSDDDDKVEAPGEEVDIDALREDIAGRISGIASRTTERSVAQAEE